MTPVRPLPCKGTFVALDGEGFTDSEGKHIYNLLAASDGSYIHSNAGLKTSECLEYLLTLKTNNALSIFVSYVFSYDVNMILRNLHPDSIKHLGKHGFCYVYDKNEFGLCYKIEYMPRKSFYLAKGIRDVSGGKRRFKVLNSIKVYDVWGFFQSSFVGALKMFNVGNDILPFIEAMKDTRTEFTPENFDKILEYNGYECSLLVELMDIVRSKMFQVNIPINQWHGAGAVAGSILRREKMKEHILEPSEGDFTTAVMSAYFGGRVQSVQVGNFGKTYAYDIVSAYPYGMSKLPSLVGSIESRVTTFQPYDKIAVYRIRWKIPTEHKVTPFPFRRPNGNIEWPYAGEGYYWYPEVKAALDCYGPEAVEIIEGFVFKPAFPNSRPFSFIPTMFADRRRLKAEGDMAQLCIKLGLNSLYGKTAQGIGFRGAKPAYQCYIYAGYITSVTRSMMLRAAMQNEDACISFATDGLTTSEPLDLPLGTDLGDWELTEFNEAFFIKPGFYVLGKEKPIKKVRGFPPSSIDFDKLAKEWAINGITGKVTCPVRHFIGMKSASEARPWCSWIDTTKTLNFYPSKGEPVYIGFDKTVRYRIIPPFYIEGISALYVKGMATAEDLSTIEFEYSVLDD